MEQPTPQNKRILKPIHMEKLPLMPVPRMSSEAMETWSWGAFCLIFQKDPPTFLDLLYPNISRRGVVNPTRYAYATSVFCRKKQALFTFETTPILVGAVEVTSYLAHPILVFFKDSTRYDYGIFQGSVTAEISKLQLFALVGNQLCLSGKPKRHAEPLKTLSRSSIKTD